MVRRRKDDSPELTQVEARQGFLDRPVLVVLIVSLCLIVAAYAFLLMRT